MTAPTNQLKIGILDSGVGGLSVLNAVHEALPHISIDYIADSAWCPYGNKQPELIKERVFSLTDKLLEQGCSLVIIACNSATIHAVEALRAEYPIPFIGMEPAVKPAVKLTETGVIGILATEASLAGEKFHKLVSNHDQGVKIITLPCPKFVDLVEAGELSGEKVKSAVLEYTSEMVSANADVLVLGCTHYPFLKQAIQQVVGENIKIIDTGKAVAKRTASILQEMTPQPSNKEPSIHIATTGNLAHLTSIFPLLCPKIQAQLSN